MDKILLNTHTKKRIESVLSRLPNSIVLVGPTGSGKGYLARHISEMVLDVKNDSTQYIIEPQKGLISIETIREVKKFLKLSVPGSSSIKRFVIILNAQQMRTEAQTALLKILEEPPSNTMIVLTVNTLNSLLPTVTSRLEVVFVRPITLKTALSITETADQTSSSIEKALLMSEGRAGHFVNFLTTTQDESLEYINLAKKILTVDRFSKLSLIENEIIKKDIKIDELLDSINLLIRAKIHSNLQAGIESISLLSRKSLLVIQARKQLLYNPNKKLLLTDLFLNL